MGQEISSSIFSPDDFREFRQRLKAETRLLAEWLREGRFASVGHCGGFELEAWLVDGSGYPAPLNQPFLQALDNPLVVPELATFNVELNSTPRAIRGTVFSEMAAELQQLWCECRDAGAPLDVRPGMIGILPSLRQSDLSLANMSPLNRYRALNEQVFRLRRGEPVELDISGRDQLQLSHQDVMLESATTSFQIHLQVGGAEMARFYNLAKMVSAPMVALSANSPFLFGRDLWDETRIPLFEQSISVGGSDLTKRVSFGVRYVKDSIMESFTANLERYPVLLPKLMDEPVERLAHLRLHNGTIWRWNRPLIAFDEAGQAQLRIEHRVVPAGPSVTDSIANAALFFGLIYQLAKTQQAAEQKLGFIRARSNFYAAARRGLDAEIFWFDWQRMPLAELVLGQLLPAAESGLAALGVEPAEIEHWLGIIRGRVETRQTGAAWQRAWVERHGHDMLALTQAYLEAQESGRPVYQWSI
jgi:gamma-glutamyl:cysteine ligase YbdK (ATP-grasp superfamily)